MKHFCSQIHIIRNFGAPFSWRDAGATLRHCMACAVYCTSIRKNYFCCDFPSLWNKFTCCGGFSITFFHRCPFLPFLSLILPDLRQLLGSPSCFIILSSPSFTHHFLAIFYPQPFPHHHFLAIFSVLTFHFPVNAQY